MATFPSPLPLRFTAEPSTAPEAVPLPSVGVGAYTRQLKTLLPRGILWRLDPESWLSRLLGGIAEEFARIDDRARDLAREWNPATAVELLPDWERVLGLPDTCIPISGSIAARQREVARKASATGGATPAYFVELAARYGFVATITENDPEPYFWRMTVDMAASASTYRVTTSRFRAGASRAGHRLSSWSVAQLECVINRAKPAHTYVAFAYV